MRTLTAIALLCTPIMAVAQRAGSSCRIDASDLHFSDYSTLDPFPNLGRSRIDVECRDADDFPVSVTISDGNSGNPQERYMRSGTQQLRYNMYVDPGRRIVAGDGSGGTSPLIARLPLPDRNIFLLFGQIFARQAVEGGNYDDRIRVDLEF